MAREASGEALAAADRSPSVQLGSLGVISDLDAAPSTVTLPGQDVRTLATSNDGQTVYAVVQRSGNGTTVVGVSGTFPSVPTLGLDTARLVAMGLRDIECDGPSPAYPPLPTGGVRNPALVDPPSGDGYFYLIRAVNPCGVASLGAGREPLAILDCGLP